MQLLEQMEDIAANSDSMFRRALAKEDAARLRKLCELAETAPSLEAYMKDGLYIGWTRDDMRSWELKDQLEPLMKAIFTLVREPDTEGIEEAINSAWPPFNQHRMKILVHCL